MGRISDVLSGAVGQQQDPRMTDADSSLRRPLNSGDEQSGLTGFQWRQISLADDFAVHANSQCRAVHRNFKIVPRITRNDQILISRQQSGVALQSVNLSKCGGVQ